MSKPFRIITGIILLIITNISIALPSHKPALDYPLLRTNVSDAAKKQLVSGVFMMIKTPSRTSTITYGTSNLKQKTTPNIKQRIRIGSITKSIKRMGTTRIAAHFIQT